MPRNFIFSCISLVLCLVGCATIGNRSSDLEVTVEHLSAPQMQLFESKATLKIRIDNETVDPIIVAGGVHHVKINGRRIGKAMDDGEISIPALSSVTRELPITLSNLGVLRSARETYESKEVTYQLDSKLYQQTASGKRARNLRRNGTITLDEFLPDPTQQEKLTPAPTQSRQ